MSFAVIQVSSKPYEDHDDCLAAAAAEYVSEHGLEAWQVTAAWDGGEDGDRESILLSVPSATGGE